MPRIVKWLASGVRLIMAKIKLGRRLKLPVSGKPVYMGHSARIYAGKGSRVALSPGAYLSDGVFLQVGEGAELVLGESVFLNEGVRLVSMESIHIGDHTLLGPNACIYDHDHIFDIEGVHADLVTAPVRIGLRCWLGANVLVTRGVQIADRILLGGGSVVTRSLQEPGIYAGSPAHLIKSLLASDQVVNIEPDYADKETDMGDRSSQMARKDCRPSHEQKNERRAYRG